VLAAAAQHRRMRALVFAAALLFAPAAQAQSLSDLAFMNGCWRTEAPAEAESGSQTTEVWASPAMPAMVGYSYTVGEGETQSWEHMRIEMIDGWPSLISMPNGAPPVAFRMVEPGAPVTDIVQFANEEHDFPKLIQYNLEDGLLIASIFGEDASSEIRWTYHRTDCAAL
jgi:hypothetical protein